MSEKMTDTAKTHRKIGPYSRTIDRGAIGQSIDGRSRPGRFLRSYEVMLGLHVGGEPSAVQRQLIARAARLALHLELMDDRALKSDDGMSERDGRQYLAWSNALSRTLRELGMKAVPIAGPTLAQQLAAERAEHERVA